MKKLISLIIVIAMTLSFAAVAAATPSVDGVFDGDSSTSYYAEYTVVTPGDETSVSGWVKDTAYYVELTAILRLLGGNAEYVKSGYSIVTGASHVLRVTVSPGAVVVWTPGAWSCVSSPSSKTLSGSIGTSRMKTSEMYFFDVSSETSYFCEVLMDARRGVLMVQVSDLYRIIPGIGVALDLGMDVSAAAERPTIVVEAPARLVLGTIFRSPPPTADGFPELPVAATGN